MPIVCISVFLGGSGWIVIPTAVRWAPFAVGTNQHVCFANSYRWFSSLPLISTTKKTAIRRVF